MLLYTVCSGINFSSAVFRWEFVQKYLCFLAPIIVHNNEINFYMSFLGMSFFGREFVQKFVGKNLPENFTAEMDLHKIGPSWRPPPGRPRPRSRARGSTWRP
jgi:hypothetical protein